MIITNDRYHMTEAENSMYAVQMTLVIRKLQKSDMGGYKCISKNSIGDAEGTIRIYGELYLFLFVCSCNMQLTTLYCHVTRNVVVIFVIHSCGSFHIIVCAAITVWLFY